MDNRVRPAQPEDAEAIASIGRRSFTMAFGHLYREEALATYLAATFSVAKIQGSLAKPANVFFVFEKDGVIEGFLKLKLEWPAAGGSPSRWQTQKLYVDPARTGHGAGRELMAAGEACMKAQGPGSSWLAVYKGNDRAIRFYEGLGFETTGTLSHDFEDLTVEFNVMEKGF